MIESPRRAVRKIYRRAQKFRALYRDDIARVETDRDISVDFDGGNNVAQRRVRQVDEVGTRRVVENVRALITSADKNVRAVAARDCVSRRVRAAPKLTAAVAREDNIHARRRAFDDFVSRNAAPVDNARRRSFVRLDEFVARAVAKVDNFVCNVFNRERARQRIDDKIVAAKIRAFIFCGHIDGLSRVIRDDFVAANVNV